MVHRIGVQDHIREPMINAAALRDDPHMVATEELFGIVPAYLT